MFLQLRLSRYDGATTLSIKTLTIMTLGIIYIAGTLSINALNMTTLIISNKYLSVVMLDVLFYYCYAE
jgi:hypothetical protein